MGADPVAEFEAYREELLAMLGDQDPLLVLRDTAAELVARLTGLSDEYAARRPEPDAWSVKEIVGHLADTEWVYGYRIRLMLSHERPGMPGYDQDLMVKGLAHNHDSLLRLLDEFEALRERNLALYSRTRGEAWRRVGVHSERGEESVELSISLLAGHDLRHLKQVDRTLSAVT